MADKLWSPSDELKKNSNMFGFMSYLKEKKSLNINSYDELYAWSIYNRADFWSALLSFSGIKISHPYEEVLENGDDMLGSKWFRGARLNFAENLLNFKDDFPAIVSETESLQSQPAIISYREMYERVAQLAKSFREAGVSIGDRVAGYLPNIPEAIISMLAATSIGAIWSSCSPDLGLYSLLDRFRQIKPKILIMSDGYSFNGRIFDNIHLIPQIKEELMSVDKIIIIPQIKKSEQIPYIEKTILYENFASKEKSLPIKFEQLPFDNPVYILYTSGTTGVPKCVVHGAGGTLLQHYKEIALHSNLKRGDKIFYATTCGWVLWNWMTTSLMLGSTLVIRDGSPFYPTADALFSFIDKHSITHFGTSARHIISTEKLGIKPGEKYKLEALKVLMYGGSALFSDNYEFVYRNIKSDIMISSMAGGTEILSCFAIGNPLEDVWSGEIQGWGLGMKCHVFNESGKAVVREKGELVCSASFPSQPIYFWDDENMRKYKESYFTTYPNVWRHGDYAEITEHNGVIIYGRSDATLNPGGVRIGTTEIYRQIESFKEIEDSVVVGQKWEGDERMILFVKMAKDSKFDEDLVKKIKTTIRKNCTVNHVPAKIIPVKEIPYTINGKKVELAVKRIIEDKPALNRGSLINPECLEFYKGLPELKY